MQNDIEMVLYIDGESIVQRFNRSLSEVRYDPENLLVVVEEMAKLAFEAKEGLKPVGSALKAELVEKHREKLIPRLAVMLGSMRENKKYSNGQIAVALMDAVCREIF